MHNVFFSEKVRVRIRKYSQDYANYFLEMYDDTGIWSEEIIRDQYKKEGVRRIDEITDIIYLRLSSEPVIGHTGIKSVTIPWRQKNLHITWEDIDDNTRIVEDLEVR